MSTLRKLMAVVVLVLVVSSCRHSSVSMQGFKYHDNAKRKPVVAMLPVVSRVDNYLPWDLSEEFTSEIQSRLFNHSDLYLNSVDMPQHLRAKLEKQDSVMLKGSDFQELAHHNDFVVLMELIEHDEKPFNRATAEHAYSDHTIDRILSMRMRVKVVDLRHTPPKVILHEIKPETHLIPSEMVGINYDRVMWGSDPFPATAYGRAHSKLQKQLAHQVENYILIAH